MLVKERKGNIKEIATVNVKLPVEMQKTEKLLSVENLRVSFYTGKRNKTGEGKIQIIRGFDIELDPGEIVGILGESGSGKTVSSSMIMQLIEKDEGTIDSGAICFKGTDLVQADEKTLQKIRGRKIAYVFQDPSLALNPYKTIGRQLTDVLRTHQLPCSRQTIVRALEEAGISDAETVYEMYPFQLSGGQNQRIMICQSILCQPELLIADEPTSAIDASLRKKILDLLITINTTYHMAVILITHDFDIARYVCSRLVIMYGGLVVEEGSLEDILREPLHPYTRELIACASSLDQHDQLLYTLEGTPITPYDFRDQCPFYARCSRRIAACDTAIPKILTLGKRKVRCIRHAEAAS